MKLEYVFWVYAAHEEIIAVVYVDGVDIGRLQIGLDQWDLFRRTQQATFVQRFD